MSVFLGFAHFFRSLAPLDQGLELRPACASAAVPLSHPPYHPEGAESISSSSEGIFLVFILVAGTQGWQGPAGSVPPSICRTPSSPAPSRCAPSLRVPRARPRAPSIRARPEERSLLPYPSSHGSCSHASPSSELTWEGGKSRGAAPERALAPRQRREQEGPWRYLGSAEERGRVREAAGGGEGRSLLQELLQLRRAGLGLGLCQALPQPEAWGARLQREQSGPTRLLGRGRTRGWLQFASSTF